MRANIADFVRESAEIRPDKVAMIQGDRILTWSQFDNYVDQIASGLSGLGLVAGHRVAMCAMNSVEIIAAYFAVVRAGCVVVPINPSIESAVVILTETKPRVIIADGLGIKGVRGHEASIVVVGAQPEPNELTFDELLNKASGNVPPSPTDRESLAAVMYTPDSSGALRGAMLTHRALIANVEQVAAMPAPIISPDDRVLVVLPVFHIFALNAILGQVAKQGAAAVIVPRFDPQETLEIIRDQKVTVVPIAPPFVSAWADGQDKSTYFASVREVLSGAAVLDPELEVEFEMSVGVALEQGWGMTEAAPVVATTIGMSRHDGPLPRGLVGHTLPGIEVRSFDDDASEIWIRGENLFSGYWPDGSDGLDGDGWYHTGELGFIDEDGVVTIVERQTDMIEVSGFRVFPFEVEEVLGEIEGVEQAVVIGVPDAETGQVVHALVVGSAEEQAIISYAAQRLAAYKVPVKVIKVTHLPATADKTHLRALARSRDLGLE